MGDSIACVRMREKGTKEIKGGICLHSVQFPVPVCTQCACSMIMKRTVIFFSEVNSMFSLNVPECLNKVSSATPVYFGEERQTGECSAVLGSLTPV